MRRYREIPGLFWQFMKFGCFTFGGGWSMIAQMQKLYVDQKKTITAEELLDLTSVGRSLPGTMIGNVAMLYGYRVAGVGGGIACVVGMVLPPLISLSVITCVYAAFRENHWVNAALSGIRAAVAPMIACAVGGLVRGAYRFPPCLMITVVTFGLYLFFQVSCVWLVVLGAVCGIALCEWEERRGGGAHGAA